MCVEMADVVRGWLVARFQNFANFLFPPDFSLCGCFRQHCPKWATWVTVWSYPDGSKKAIHIDSLHPLGVTVSLRPFPTSKTTPVAPASWWDTIFTLSVLSSQYHKVSTADRALPANRAHLIFARLVSSGFKSVKFLLGHVTLQQTRLLVSSDRQRWEHYSWNYVGFCYPLQVMPGDATAICRLAQKLPPSPSEQHSDSLSALKDILENQERQRHR